MPATDAAEDIRLDNQSGSKVGHVENAIDQAAAHRFFSANCFNAVWELLDKADRNAADNERMIALAHASVWHWTQRADCTSRAMSIGYWQLSRVYAVIGHGERAQHYGHLCLDVSQNEEPFFLGYAHEALARAAAVMNDAKLMNEHLQQARKLAAVVADGGDRQALEADLDTVKLKTS